MSEDDEDVPEDSLEDVPGVTGTLSKFAKPTAAVAVLIVIVYAVSVFHGLPLAIIKSDSMEPVLSRGDVIYFEAADPAELQVDDIVAVEVPSGYRDKYGYPPTIVHRIVEIGEYAKGTFVVTKGDATSKDPFRAHVSNVKGIYRKLDLPLIGSTWPKLPLAGTVLLFLRSTYGLIYVVALTATAVGYRAIPAWLEGRKRKEERVEEALGSSRQTQEDIASLTGAMAEYAQHLRSHTAAVQELSETTKELRGVVGDLDGSDNPNETAVPPSVSAERAVESGHDEGSDGEKGSPSVDPGERPEEIRGEKGSIWSEMRKRLDEEPELPERWNPTREAVESGEVTSEDIGDLLGVVKRMDLHRESGEPFAVVETTDGDRATVFRQRDLEDLFEEMERGDRVAIRFRGLEELAREADLLAYRYVLCGPDSGETKLSR